jgi:polyferredoxin
MTVDLLVLAPIAGLMVLASAGLIRWAAEAESEVRASVVVFLMAMMVAMIAAAFVYYLHPGPASLVEGLWLGATVMSLSVFPVVSAILRELRARLADPGGQSPIRAPGRFIAVVVALVLVNELLMGATFQLASGGSLPAIGANGAGIIDSFAAVVVSPWFLFTMSAEMGLTAVLLRHRIDPVLLGLAGTQSLLMLASPPVFADPRWVSSTVYLSSLLMIGAFVFLLEYIYRHRQLRPALSSYFLRLLLVYALMMAGLYVWLADGAVALFAASVVLEMVLFFDATTRPGRYSSGVSLPWQLNARWALGVLSLVFIAELFMGALLDLEINGPGFLELLPNLPLSGPPGPALYAAVYNGFWFVATVTNSAWFLIMMGAEMGALVVFKIRETVGFELRARLGLMIAAYAAFTVYLPGFWSTLPIRDLPDLSTVPVVGWNMGIGTGGPAAPELFGAILITYVVLASLSTLFGRRVLCSVFCNAPLMMQGTLPDAMKSFNRSSTIGRRYLGSRFSTAYSVTLAISLVSLAGATVVSYLDAIGRLAVTFAGADPVQFLFSFYFGVLWYVMFVTIPYTGNYNCVTMGWCHWGSFSAAFSRIGFFRLRVKDRGICRACTTLDCAKSCPVGLVDLVGQLRTTGEFRSSKCCGVGDCVGACPYGNLYIHDVRHWWRGRSRPAPGDGVPLPMVGASLRRATATPTGSGAAAAGSPAAAGVLR